MLGYCCYLIITQECPCDWLEYVMYAIEVDVVAMSKDDIFCLVKSVHIEYDKQPNAMRAK